MLNDLVENHKLKDQTYREMIGLFGEPQNSLDSTNEVGYQIDVNYSNDIDPVYSKTLILTFSKDSLVQNYWIEEWKK